jgi:uncharacterized membrane protein (DUF4010 family)
MLDLDSTLLGFAVALGVGLLIGIDRERTKGEGPARGAAGIRTFTIAALAGAVALELGGETVLAVVTGGVIALAAISYWRATTDDPGLTTEVALIITTLLGGLALREPALAAGIGVMVAVLLHTRAMLHRFVRSGLTEAELRDALIFAGATLVVLPLLPEYPLDPFGALNLRMIWTVVILVMAVGGAGYVATRLLGVRFGLPLSGLASGFVSSAATIAAMAGRVKETPALLRPGAAAAILSTVATIVQLAILLAATSLPTLKAMILPLAAAGLAAALYGGGFTLWALRQKAEADGEKPGRAFSFTTALILAATLAVVLVGSAALQAWLGETGVVLAAGAAGFADAHSAAVSVASLVSANKLEADHQAVMPILAALTTNTATKIVLAFTAGSRAFAVSVVPGLLLVAGAAWAGAFV